MDAGTLLQVTNLDAGYGAKRVVHGASLHVGEGEIIAILGHNGAGKSTLLNAVCGVIKPTTGQVLFRGHDITGFSPSASVPAGISYAPQGGQIFRTLSVTDNLLMGGFTQTDQGGLAAKVAEVRQLFPALDARRDVRAGSLSGGERQMLAIGMLLLASPRLVVLDEPSGGLSPLFVDRVYDAIRGIRDRVGASVVLVEQDLSHALDVADRVYVLANGRIIHECARADFGHGDALAQKLLGFQSQ